MVATASTVAPVATTTAAQLGLIPPGYHLNNYNLTLNFTTLLSFLPSKLLQKSKLFTHLWRTWDHAVKLGMESESVAVGDLLAEGDWSAATDSILEAAAAQATTTPRSMPSPATMYPGPWGFFISGYMLGIFLMAVILHRIQNIIIPSQIPNRQGRGLRPGISISWQRRFGYFGRISSAIFPLDLAKTSTRLAIHLPTLYFLIKMLLIWGVLALQTSGYYPQDTGINWVDQLGEEVKMMDMQNVCWQTFVAVCAGFSVEGFVKALDGVEAGFPIGGNMNPNTSPFNIFGYAFLLHLYASPFAHSNRPEGLPSRPDKHAIVTVAIPLLQLTLFHMLSVSKRWSSHRLFPTMLTSFLSLTHFHGALLSFYRNPHPAQSPQSKLLTTYPILNYIPNIFETLLLLTITLTILLNIIVQMVIRGRVDRVFSGLGVSPLPYDDEDTARHISNGTFASFLQNLPLDEDFGVLLLRIGTASLEATGLRGWSNEVAPIPAPIPRRSRKRSSKQVRGVLAASSGLEYGSVRVGRVGAGGVQSGTRMLPARGMVEGGARRNKPRLAKGLLNEVRHVDLGMGITTAGGGGQRPQGNGEQGMGNGQWWRWLREVGRYLEAAWAAFRGLAILVWAWARSKAVVTSRKGGRRRTRRVGAGRAVDITDSTLGARDVDDQVGEESGEEGEDERGIVLYERFLAGDNISDDEDDEFRIDGECEELDEEEGEGEDSSPTSRDGTPLETAGEEEDPEQEAFSLFADLMRSQREGSVGPSSSHNVALAHLMMNSSPLTRRRWSESLARSVVPQARFGGPGVPGVWPDNDEEQDDEDEDEQDEGTVDLGKATCVICTSEARDIICWPCRCLAMCDGCREALASRSAPSKHQCPCCRQLIEGYSRIYIP